MKKPKKKAASDPRDARTARVEAAAVTGTLAGAAVGAVAGPPGMVAGAMVGGVVGAITGLGVADAAEWRHKHAAKLDEDVGVTGGDLGAASPDLPPARIGAFSSGSTGVATRGGSPPSEGPMQDLDD